MPYPSGPTAHFDRPLSNFAAQAFASQISELGLVGHSLLPLIDVGAQSDTYYVIERDAFHRLENTRRAPRTRANRVEFTVSSDTYFAENYALAGENSLEDLAKADSPIRLRENQVTLVTRLLAMDEEHRIASTVTSGTNNGSYTTLTGANSVSKWSVNSTSVSIYGQVSTAHATIRSQTGMTPNTAVVDWNTMEAARNHVSVRAMFGNSDGIVPDEFLKKNIFRVNSLFVASAIKNTGKEGQTFASANIWGNCAWFGYIGPATGLQTVSYGGRMVWTPPIFPARGSSGGIPTFGVERSVEAGAGSRKVEVVEAGYYQAEKVISSELGNLINNTL